jgi:bifunctional DNase/RNase
LSFRMTISGLLDTTNSFIIKKMLLGMQRLHKRVDSRRPITIDLLVHIFYALQYTCSSVYETALFSSSFSLAFLHFYELLYLICQRGICYNIPIYQLIRKMV